MPKKSPSSTPISSLKHADKRANIPTEELRDFVADEEKQPKTVLYPRDPSLDPQLVWKGKDEQDQQDLAVPAVPVYIQEKISPQAIIENVRASAKTLGDFQLSLFADFNNISFQDLVDFYHHEQNWTNRLILGDSLLVMNSLAEKEGLKGKVQMIYLDPPYGIKFGSNWQVSTRKRDVKDGKAEDATRQPEQVKAFRDTWELGIHSYLSYLRDRFILARELLTESGSLFLQIGEENVHIVRNVLDEIFGSENYCSQIIFRKTTGKGSALLDNTFDILLWYAKNRENVKYRSMYVERLVNEDENLRFVELEDGNRRALSFEEWSHPATIPAGGKAFRPNPLTSQSASSTTLFEYKFENKGFSPGKGGWKTNIVGMEKLYKSNRLVAVGNTLSFIRYLGDFPYKPINDIWDDTRQSGFGDPKIYVVQTTLKVIERCIQMTTDPGDLVLDPTCGSGTTAYVTEQWGRRWITIDTSRVAIALARTRLMAGRYPYYLLADSPEGVLKEAELAGQVPSAGRPPAQNDIKRGFVYRRVPHVTLKSIANNPEIDAIYEKYQSQLEPLRADLNRLAHQSWEDHQIPRDLPSSQAYLPGQAINNQQSEISNLHSAWWSLRKQRQSEIDASISRRAETELLYDQPYEDNKRIRVAGPFTVESLSPHRMLSAEEERPCSEVDGQKEGGLGQFEAMILANLKTAGVQNTRKQERLKFDRLEPYAGLWLHATGEYTEKDGAVKRAAVCIGPEHGTVGPDLVKEAAKEAVKGVGFDLLIVCGFAFDPFVGEEANQYGRLTVLPVRMNPDLSMGSELLKKTGAANLFMIFGEPDLEIQVQADGKICVTVNGVDVYDPTTGEIRSSSTDDIACWFIDTDYNGESFFVRHAYFTGADEPYEKLKRALRAEVDEAAWSSLYQTTSLPFERPKGGKIAVKVINHYGDEVLKVYGV